MTYRPAIFLGLLVPLLIWQRSSTRAPETREEAAPPMAATKRPRMAPAAPLRDVADAAARGTRDSLRSWASGLDDEEILDHLQTTLDRIAADTTRSKEELFHLRPLLCALAMEGGRRDIESFLRSLDSMVGSENVVLAYPALAGHAETDPADAWGRLPGIGARLPELEGSRSGGSENSDSSFPSPEPQGIHSGGSEIAGQIFRLWTLRDPEAAMAALDEYVMHKESMASWDGHAVAALAAIVRVSGPDAVPGLELLLEGYGSDVVSRRAEISAALAVHDVAAAQKLDPDARHTDRFITRWTQDDPDAALNYATSLGTQEALLAVATGLFRDDPRRAMELLYSLNDPEAARACIGSWKDGDHEDDGAWPVFEGASPRVSRVTRKDAILIALHRLEQTE